MNKSDLIKLEQTIKYNIIQFYDELDISMYINTYTGITEDSLQNRLEQHILEEPIKYNKSWRIINIPNTDIIIKYDVKYKNLYIQMMKRLENIAINKCHKLFGKNRNSNAKNKDNTPSQTGGAGKTIKSINKGDINKFYFLYSKS